MHKEEIIVRKGKEEMIQEVGNTIEGTIEESRPSRDFSRDMRLFSRQRNNSKEEEEAVLKERIKGVCQEKMAKESIRIA